MGSGLGESTTNFETVTQDGRIVKMMTLHTKQSNSISKSIISLPTKLTVKEEIHKRQASDNLRNPMLNH